MLPVCIHPVIYCPRLVAAGYCLWKTAQLQLQEEVTQPFFFVILSRRQSLGLVK